MVNFKENYHFPRFQGVQLFPGWGGGSNYLFPIETHITCDFPRGGRPCLPFICLRFLVRFSDIVGGSKLRRMCLHSLRSPCDFFRSRTSKLHQRSQYAFYSYHNDKFAQISMFVCFIYDVSVMLERPGLNQYKAMITLNG